MPGPTGKYPRGKAGPDDEGELEFHIASDDERDLVVLDFGIPVHCIGMPPEQALELGRDLYARGAAMIARQRAKRGAH